MTTCSGYNRDDIEALPLRAFDGKVHVITKPRETVWALQKAAQHAVVGFDTETRPSFRKGEQHDVALMQIATPNEAFLIRISHVAMIDEILAFLENERIIKAGVGLENDIRALTKLRAFAPRGFVELSMMARGANLKAESVKKLAGEVLGFRVSKSAQVSNWEASQYTAKQVSYAATDAWVCMLLYEKLSSALAQQQTDGAPLDMRRYRIA